MIVVKDNDTNDRNNPNQHMNKIEEKRYNI